MSGSSRVFLIRSTLLSTRSVGVFSSFSTSSMKRSPGPAFTEASTISATTSTSRMVPSAVFTMRAFSRCVALCTPGVSTKTICPAGASSCAA